MAPNDPQYADDQLSRDLQSLRISRDEKPAGQGSGKVLRWVAIAVLVPVIGFFVWRFASKKAEGALFKTEVSFTEVSSISPAQASVEVTSTGYVVPQLVAKVGSKITGRISKVHVREGMALKSGAPLFELDPSDQRSAIASANARVLSAKARAQAARANLAEIELQWKRQKALAATGAVGSASAEDLGARVSSLQEQVKAQDAEALAIQAEVSALSVALTQTTILAPIDGIATTKPAEVGDVVNPGTPLVELVDFGSLLVETDVPEGRLNKVKAGGPTEVVLDSMDGQRFRGIVVEVSPRLNRAKATATVKVRFKEPPKELRPEMSARVSFLSKELSEGELKQGEKIVVPGNAVVSRGADKVVWVVEGDKVRSQVVELGEAIGTGFVVKNGTTSGTKLVRDPPATLTDGQGVKEKGK
ncbi:MAG: efflux RND transporter periplasmic adaptor subunit [Polyangiaceae bacterium]